MCATLSNLKQKRFLLCHKTKNLIVGEWNTLFLGRGDGILCHHSRLNNILYVILACCMLVGNQMGDIITALGLGSSY
jgi:hypothetical protein